MQSKTEGVWREQRKEEEEQRRDLLAVKNTNELITRHGMGIINRRPLTSPHIHPFRDVSSRILFLILLAFIRDHDLTISMAPHDSQWDQRVLEPFRPACEDRRRRGIVVQFPPCCNAVLPIAG